MKLFTRNENKKYIKKTHKILAGNAKYLIKDFYNDSELYGMIHFSYLYFSIIQLFNYGEKLKKKGIFEKFKQMHPKEYDDYLEKLNQSNTEVFIPIFGKTYDELKESKELGKISEKIVHFLNFHLDGEKLNNFVLSIGTEYEFFIYLLLDDLLNLKIFYNKEHGISDIFLEKKMQEYSEAGGEFNMMRENN